MQCAKVAPFRTGVVLIFLLPAVETIDTILLAFSPPCLTDRIRSRSVPGRFSLEFRALRATDPAFARIRGSASGQNPGFVIKCRSDRYMANPEPLYFGSPQSAPFGMMRASAGCIWLSTQTLTVRNSAHRKNTRICNLRCFSRKSEFELIGTLSSNLGVHCLTQLQTKI